MSLSLDTKRGSSRRRSSMRLRRLSNIMPSPIADALQHLLLPAGLDSILKGHDGFEELRKYIKQGSEFSKEVAAIMQERADLENSYSKSLHRLSGKLMKAVGSSVGTLADGWKAVATAMEQQSELHKNLSNGLQEDISKPLRTLMEAQTKSRKPIEAMVDKAYKNVTDRRAEEYRSKKQSLSCARDYEKAEDNASEKTGKEKNLSKREKKCKHSHAAMRKADKEYVELCYKAEAARQDWDFTVSKGSCQLQQLEEERMKQMQEFLNKYNSQLAAIPPRLTQICDRLHEAVISVDMNNDLRLVAEQKGSKTPRQPEQILVDCYAEDSQFSMKNDRRQDSMKNFLIYLYQYIEKDRKGREGVQKLVEVYRERPNFADPEAQQDAQQRLEQTTFMLNFLEASHYKIAASLAKLEKRDPPTFKFSQYIETARDKQGHLVSTLRLPYNLAQDGSSEYSPINDNNDIYVPMDDDFYDDEFDDVPQSRGRCKVLYKYDASRDDELSIEEGDIIEIYQKLQDGWWQGELKGKVGIFPSTYVQEL